MAIFHTSTTVPSFIQSYFHHVPSNGSSEQLYTAVNLENTSLVHRWAILLVLLIIYPSFHVLRYLFFHGKPPSGLKRMPGPSSTIPYIGRLDIDPYAPWNTMREWADQFNGMFQLTMCGETHIWLGDADVAQELYCKRPANYRDRPEVAAVPGSNSQGQYLPLLEEGEHWRRQKKFVGISLTLAQNNEYHGYITLEAKRFLYKLLEDPRDHYSLSDRFCGRVAARLCYGKPNCAAAQCKNAQEFISHISPSVSGPITNIFPFLGKLPEWLNPSKVPCRQRREREERLWTGLMGQVLKEVEAGTAKTSFARSYFERKAAAARGDERSFGFEEYEAAYTVGMLCTVATATIGGPLYCFFLAMVLNPEWQEKCRAEIDAAVGDHRLVKPSDAPKLPTLRACIKECIRWRPPVPMGVPRVAAQGDEYNGYFIPQGAVMHAVDMALARNPTLYPDGDSYNPGRWLDPEFPTYKEPLTVHPRLLGHHSFGRGHRMCPGAELVEAELLVACGSLLWAFTMKPNIGEDGQPLWPDSKAFTTNIIGGPLPFEFDLQVRSEQRRNKIFELYNLDRESGG